MYRPPSGREGFTASGPPATSQATGDGKTARCEADVPRREIVRMSEREAAAIAEQASRLTRNDMVETMLMSSSGRDVFKELRSAAENQAAAPKQKKTCSVM